MEEVVDLELQDLSNIQGALPRLLYRLNEDSPKKRVPSRIRMTPDTIRHLSPSSFDPRVVSIGPLHRHDKNVQAFEPRKATYVDKLMRCIDSPEEEILKSCVDRVSPKTDNVRRCYGWHKDYNADEFIEFMVMDACFILGFINHISKYLRNRSYGGSMMRDHTVIFDLVLIENQIPFFFLDEIFQCTVLKYKPNTTLVEFLSPLLNLLNIFSRHITSNNVNSSTIAHILSLLYECYKPRDNSIKPCVLTSTPRSAVDLDSVGVNFKPNDNPKWLMGVDVKLKTFLCFSWCWGKPTLKMHVLYIHDFTELVLRNLIAYEHELMQPNHEYVLSYAYFMEMLMNTQDDVAKLVESRVLFNHMGSNHEAAKMMKTICKEFTREQFFYDEELNKLDMDKYCIGYLLKNIMSLKSTYFNSPWNVIALFAGIILFVLTVIQTIFTVKPAS